MNKYGIYILILTVLLSCSRQEEDKNAIARVYDSYLYESDLEEVLPTDFLAQDSLLLVKNYINSWAKEQLLLKKAAINLNDDSNIEALVNQYRQDILIEKYKAAAVAQYLDTTVTDEDVVKFYNENRQIFKLNEELVQFSYIHFGNDILNPDEFKEIELKSFNFNDSIWIRLEDVMSKISVFDNDDKTRFLKKTKFFKKEDSLGVYLVAVKNALERNQTAPMSYVLSTIKQMIIHKRKLDLLKKIEETLVDDAMANKEFETFETDKNE